MESTYSNQIKLVVFDTAGTICDGPNDLRSRWPHDDGKGCKAPVVPFYELFKSEGIELSWDVIRKPMGVYKPTHLRMLLEDPDVQEQWKEKHNGKAPDEQDFKRMLPAYRSLLSKYILDEDLSRPIAGTKEAFARIHRAGALIGLDTGYFGIDAQQLNQILAEKFGVKADVETNGDEAPGRPSPFMIYDCMRKAYEIKKEVFGCHQVVKVDDTATGIVSGNNAGALTIGVYASGSNSYEQLKAAEPDYLVPDITYVPDIVFSHAYER